MTLVGGQKSLGLGHRAVPAPDQGSCYGTAEPQLDDEGLRLFDPVRLRLESD